MESTVSTLVEIACEAGVHDACGISANAEICGDKVLLEVVTTAKPRRAASTIYGFNNTPRLSPFSYHKENPILEVRAHCSKARIQRKSIEACP
ncbi:hypothetical protein H4Q26_008505 [Puccinia striiformis f. sp. tritici PST-130]|nr:hypothetical protein H4Q26_008505 [Puccinia striiformis f. sp. tritici PST-130]